MFFVNCCEVKMRMMKVGYAVLRYIVSKCDTEAATTAYDEPQVDVIFYW